jgi:hypothetical protein
MFTNKISFKKIVASTLMLGMMTVGLSNSFQASAAGLAVTLSPSTSTVSNTASITLSATLINPIDVAGLVQVVYPTAGYTGTPTLSISTGTVGATTTATSGSDTIVSAPVTTTAIPAGAAVVTIAGLTTSSIPSINALSLYTSGGDFGSAFQYSGGANEVTVRGIVPVSLSFTIRNAADTANTNVCDMGNLSISTIGSCSYRLKVKTNAQNGYTINKASATGFTNGSYVFEDANISNAGTGGSAQSAGEELYGAKIDKGSVSTAGGVVTLAANFDAGAINNVNYSGTSPEALVSSNKPNNPTATDTVNTSLVTHEAGIRSSTAAGIYTQKVTYTVTPVFQAVTAPFVPA